MISNANRKACGLYDKTKWLCLVLSLLSCLVSLDLLAQEAPEFQSYDDQFLISDPIFLSDPLSRSSRRDTDGYLGMAADGIRTLLIWLELENDGLRVVQTDPWELEFRQGRVLRRFFSP